MEESWVEQLSTSLALTLSYLPYLMSREIVVFRRCTSFGNYPNEKTRPLSPTIEVSAILALSSNADEYQRPQDTADPNRSAVFLHPLQEDSCLAVVSKDLGAGKLVLGYSLFTVVRASNESTRLDFSSWTYHIGQCRTHDIKAFQSHLSSNGIAQWDGAGFMV